MIPRAILKKIRRIEIRINRVAGIFCCLCVAMLLSVFSLRGAAEDFTNVIHPYLQKCIEAGHLRPTDQTNDRAFGKIH